MELISSIFVVIISFLTVIYAYFKYSYQYWKSKGVPFDEPTFPFGNIKGLGTSMHQRKFTQKLYAKYKPSGAKLCGVYFFNVPVAILFDLEVIKNVLVRDFTNFDDRNNIFYNQKDDPLSGNLFSLAGEEWRKLRTKLTPTFTSGKMKFMFSTVVGVAEQFRDCLNDIIKEHDELEMKELLARFTTDVIGTCAFGLECNSLKDPNAEFRHYGRLLTTKRRHNELFLVLMKRYKRISKILHVKLLPDDVAAFFMKVVLDTVAYREKNNVRRNDFMDLLIDLKNGNQESSDMDKLITLNELAAQAFIFFLGGFETSSTALSFCLFELALNPDIQSKARCAIKEAFKKYNGQFTYEMLTDIPYVNQLMEETLRKWSPVSNLYRKAKNDYLIPGTNVIIEKGMDIQVPIYAIHHDPEYYPNPEKFDPERFSSEEKNKRNPMTWLPFGDGPRNCIGLRFAQMQIRIALVTLLNNFEFSFSPKTVLPFEIDEESVFFAIKGGIYLKLKPIETNV